MAHEARNNECWSCKYFFELSDISRNGFCMRHAPRKFDWDEGSPVRGTDFGQFSFIVEAGLVVCGRYERMIGTVPTYP